MLGVVGFNLAVYRIDNDHARIAVAVAARADHVTHIASAEGYFDIKPSYT